MNVIICSVLLLVIAEIWTAVYVMTESRYALKLCVWWHLAAVITAIAAVYFNEKSSEISMMYL